MPYSGETLKTTLTLANIHIFGWKFCTQIEAIVITFALFEVWLWPLAVTIDLLSSNLKVVTRPINATYDKGCF